MNVEFRFANGDEYPAIARFLNDHWAANHIYVRSEPLFRWTFARPGYWEPGGFSVAVGVSGNELVGILGGIPFDFNILGTTHRGVWLANYVIREDHRKGPTALKLLSMLRGSPYGATVSFGINPATANLYRVLRGRVMPLIPRHVAVLPEATGRIVTLLKIAHPEWTDAVAQEFAGKYVANLQPKPDIGASSSLPDDWDELNWKQIAPVTVGAVRDRKYLEWRYMQHPLFDYRIIGLPEGGRTGLLVWRLETIHRVIEHQRVPVDRIARLLEFLPASDENALRLYCAFLAQIREAEALGVDYYGFHGPTAIILEKLGLRKCSERDAELFPSRFQPLDGKGGNIMSAAFLPAETPECTLDPACPWYWTKSDSDQDRPN